MMKTMMAIGVGIIGMSFMSLSFADTHIDNSYTGPNGNTLHRTVDRADGKSEKQLSVQNKMGQYVIDRDVVRTKPKSPAAAK
jgi:hypothetical protein